MTTVQQIKELYKVIKQNGQATTSKCIVGANAYIYTNLGINLSGTTAAPNPYSVMIGQNSSVQGDHSIAIGKGAYAKDGCVALGQYTTMAQSDDFRIIIGDGDANTRHNCFTSNGSFVTIDNKVVTVGNNASVVSIGNATSSRVIIGDGTASTVRIGNETASYVNIGNGNRSTVRIGDNENAQIGIGNKTGAAVNIGNGVNSYVYLGYATSSRVIIGEGNNSTVNIGKSFEGADIWNASNILFDSPASNIYIPIKFDSYEVTLTKSSTGGARAAIPLNINNRSYTLYNIPRGTRYAITVTSSVSWTQTDRLSALSLGENPQIPSTPVPLEVGSDKNDSNNSRSVFVATNDMFKEHNNLGIYIVHPISTDSEYKHTIYTTMYVPLSGLALFLMQKNFN